jgi:hypothetical protein
MSRMSLKLALGTALVLGAAALVSVSASGAQTSAPPPGVPLSSASVAAASLPSFQQVKTSLGGALSLSVNGNAVSLESIVSDVVSLRENAVQQLASAAATAINGAPAGATLPPAPAATTLPSQSTTVPASTTNAVTSAVSAVMAPSYVLLTEEQALAQETLAQLLYNYAQQNGLVASYSLASQICSQNLSAWESDGSPAIVPLDGNGETAQQMLDSPAAIAFTQQVLSERAAETAVAGPLVVNGIINTTALGTLRLWFATALQDSTVLASIGNSSVPASSLPPLLQSGV